jgi:hypothetical protein
MRKEIGVLILVAATAERWWRWRVKHRRGRRWRGNHFGVWFWNGGRYWCDLSMSWCSYWSDLRCWRLGMLLGTRQGTSLHESRASNDGNHHHQDQCHTLHSCYNSFHLALQSRLSLSRIILKIQQLSSGSKVWPKQNLASSWWWITLAATLWTKIFRCCKLYQWALTRSQSSWLRLCCTAAWQEMKHGRWVVIVEAASCTTVKSWQTLQGGGKHHHRLTSSALLQGLNKKSNTKAGKEARRGPTTQWLKRGNSLE